MSTAHRLFIPFHLQHRYNSLQFISTPLISWIHCKANIIEIQYNTLKVFHSRKRPVRHYNFFPLPKWFYNWFWMNLALHYNGIQNILLSIVIYKIRIRFDLLYSLRPSQLWARLMLLAFTLDSRIGRIILRASMMFTADINRRGTWNGHVLCAGRRKRDVWSCWIRVIKQTDLCAMSSGLHASNFHQIFRCSTFTSQLARDNSKTDRNGRTVALVRTVIRIFSSA